MHSFGCSRSSNRISGIRLAQAVYSPGIISHAFRFKPSEGMGYSEFLNMVLFLDTAEVEFRKRDFKSSGMLGESHSILFSTFLRQNERFFDFRSLSNPGRLARRTRKAHLLLWRCRRASLPKVHLGSLFFPSTDSIYSFN